MFSLAPLRPPAAEVVVPWPGGSSCGGRTGTFTGLSVAEAALPGHADMEENPLSTLQPCYFLMPTGRVLMANFAMMVTHFFRNMV